MSDKGDYVGVFDSGLGGISVLKDLKEILPKENFIYYGDSGNAPYGIKTRNEIIDRCIDVCEFLINKGCKAIVIACNTATSAAAELLREKYKDIIIVGMEPALKPALNGSDNTVVVMATPFTLKEKKFNDLVDAYAGETKVIRMPCLELVNIVENDNLDNDSLVKKQLKSYYNNIDLKDVNSVVLGCTHFVFYKKYLQEMLGPINIVDGNIGTARNLKSILERTDRLSEGSGSVQFFNSQDEQNKVSSGVNKLELGKSLFSRK